MMTNTAPDEASRHKCLIYDGHPAEQLPVIAPLLIEGLRSRQRCLYLGNPEMVKMVDGALASRGVDTAAEARRGALILSSDRSHLQSGTFDPRTMVTMLRGMIDEAVSQGFEGLCATGDMMWELGTEANFKNLLEYEALLEQVFQEKPLQGICQYHRGLVPGHAIQDALLAHRSVYVGDVLNSDNLFYVPPEVLLEDNATRDRRGTWMCQQIIRIMNAERKRDQALAALRDSEAQQRRLARDLAEANRGLEARVRERTAQLEAVNEELEAFSHSVSHDLRAPLRHIDSFSQALEQDCGKDLDEHGRGHLQRVRAATRRMGELIDDLLKLSHVTQAEMRRDRIDLSHMGRRVVEELRSSEPERRVQVEIAEGLTADGDDRLVQVVLENLLRNAWKFTKKRSLAHIHLGAAQQDGQSVFFVRDDGAGFDMQYAGKLFGAFQRLHRQEEFQGTGVGLATVHRIILRHGGRIWAEAKPDEGATFFFTLSPKHEQLVSRSRAEASEERVH
jgi:signal transduction histidine kinase